MTSERKLEPQQRALEIYHKLHDYTVAEIIEDIEEYGDPKARIKAMVGWIQRTGNRIGYRIGYVISYNAQDKAVDIELDPDIVPGGGLIKNLTDSHIKLNLDLYNTFKGEVAQAETEE